MSKLLAWFALVLTFSTSPRAEAVVGPPTLDPPNPIAGQTVSIDIYAGVCDAFTDDPAPIVTRDGNDIRMVISGIVSTDPEFCIFPIGTYVFEVGAFASGTYSLQVDRTYLGTDGLVTETLGTLPFVVSKIASAPALGAPGLCVLVLAVLTYAGSAFRASGSASTIS